MADRGGSSPTGSLLVLTELRASVTPDGAVWAQAGSSHEQWAGAPGSSDVTTVAMRVEAVSAEPPGTVRIDGPAVRVLALPELRPGPLLPRHLLEAARLLRHADDGAALVLVLPGVVGSLGLIHALIRRRPFAVQVVGDPLEVTRRAKVGGRGRVAMGTVLAGLQRLACRRAVAALYVTDGFLQSRYPPGPRTSVHACSNVVLPSPRPAPTARRPSVGGVVRLVTVASLEQPYKRVDLLLEAMSVLVGEGWALHLDVVGGGRIQPDLEGQAARLGLATAVTFHGLVARDRVDALVSEADLFVLCSDTEGMPRALIEAMAAGLPCVGSSVGGVPEVLPPEARFRPGSLPSLVGALRRALVGTRLRERSATVAMRRAHDFEADQLEPQRAAFLAAVRDRAAAR